MKFREGRNGGKLKSGNTIGVGRPKMPDLKEVIAKALSSDKNGKQAIEEIIEAMQEKARKGDVKAAEFLFDRGYGKASQDIHMKQEGTQEVIIRVIEDDGTHSPKA